MKHAAFFSLLPALLLVFPAKAQESIRQASGSVECATGARIHADFFFPTAVKSAPAVVVVHGFSRHKEHMRDWGKALAGSGYVAAVINLPFFTGLEKNTAAVVDFVKKGRQNQWPVPVKIDGRTGLLGFSMGGAVTLLAASQLVPPVSAWAGLDPVDFNNRAGEAAASVTAPGLALLAEPGVWNRNGNARSMLRNYAGPLELVDVPGATHADPEWPGDWLARAVCGGTDPARQKIFREKILEFFRQNRNPK